MSKQRFVIFLIAIIGMIATFLPWYEIGSLGMVMGYQTVGWFTFVMFALVFLFGLRKGVKQDMSTGLLYLGSFFSLLAAFVVLWQIITLGLDQEGGSMSVAGKAQANDTRDLNAAYQDEIAGNSMPIRANLNRQRKRSKETICIFLNAGLGELF